MPSPHHMYNITYAPSGANTPAPPENTGSGLHYYLLALTAIPANKATINLESFALPVIQTLSSPSQRGATLLRARISGDSMLISLRPSDSFGPQHACPGRRRHQPTCHSSVRGACLTVLWRAGAEEAREKAVVGGQQGGIRDQGERGHIFRENGERGHIFSYIIMVRSAEGRELLVFGCQGSGIRDQLEIYENLRIKEVGGRSPPYRLSPLPCPRFSSPLIPRLCSGQCLRFHGLCVLGGRRWEAGGLHFLAGVC